MPKEKQQSDFTVTENDGASFIVGLFFFFFGPMFNLEYSKFVTGKAYNPRILYGVKKNKGLPALTGKSTGHPNNIWILDKQYVFSMSILGYIHTKICLLFTWNPNLIGFPVFYLSTPI